MNNCLMKPVICQNFDEPLLNLCMIDVFPHLIAYTVIFVGPAQLKVTGRFCASLKHKYDGQTKFIKPNSQRQDRIIKYWVSIGSIHREQG